MAEWGEAWGLSWFLKSAIHIPVGMDRILWVRLGKDGVGREAMGSLI